MQGPITLTAEEFTQIHNALWNLSDLNNRLEEVLKEHLYLANRKVEHTIRDALANAYKQEEAIFKEKTRYFNQVRNTHNFASLWSMFEVDHMTDPHPYTNAKWVGYEGHQAEIKGSWWIDLWDATDRALKAAGEQHYIYIESFDQSEEIVFAGTGS